MSFIHPLDFCVVCILLIVRPKAPKAAVSQTRAEKGNQEFLVPSLSGDKAFSSRENNVRASERAEARESVFLSDEREGGDEQVGEYLLADSACRAGAERTAEVSYRRLSAGESRGLVATKKAKERRRRQRKKKKKKKERREGGRKELRTARKTAFGFYRRPRKREEPAHCRLLAAFRMRF